MSRWRKKPVVIDAYQVRFPSFRDERDDWPVWFAEAMAASSETVGSLNPTDPEDPRGTVSVYTLEGAMKVSWKDWVIRGIQGELYPCKPDVFEATYAPVPLLDGA